QRCGALQRNFSIGSSACLRLLETEIRICAVGKKRFNNFHDVVFFSQIPSNVAISHDQKQRIVASEIRGVGIGAGVEQHIDDLHVDHGGGDGQSRHIEHRLGDI